MLQLANELDYIRTEQTGTFIKEFDKFCSEFSEMQEFLMTTTLAKSAEQAIESIYEKGLILSLLCN